MYRTPVQKMFGLGHTLLSLWECEEYQAKVAKPFSIASDPATWEMNRKKLADAIKSLRGLIPHEFVQRVLSGESVEKIEDEITINENYIDQEDPPESFQLGDIVWLRVPGNPWWPALIHGRYSNIIL